MLSAAAAAGVIADPDVAHYTRQAGDEFLLLASDGLWGVLSNQVGHCTAAAAAALLAAETDSMYQIVEDDSAPAAARVAARMLHSINYAFNLLEWALLLP
jgi:serine/threonine protein phosphatase PrpC